MIYFILIVALFISACSVRSQTLAERENTTGDNDFLFADYDSFILSEAEGQIIDDKDSAYPDDSSQSDADMPISCIGKFPNQHEGLCWSDKAAIAITLADAEIYCGTIGGRLPTISELRTLIQNCSTTVTGGTCGVTDNCLNNSSCWSDVCGGCTSDSSGKYSVFGDKTYLWSDSHLLGNASLVWYVYFHYSEVFFNYNYYSNDVRCVK